MDFNQYCSHVLIYRTCLKQIILLQLSIVSNLASWLGAETTSETTSERHLNDIITCARMPSWPIATRRYYRTYYQALQPLKNTTKYYEVLQTLTKDFSALQNTTTAEAPRRSLRKKQMLFWTAPIQIIQMKKILVQPVQIPVRSHKYEDRRLEFHGFDVGTLIFKQGFFVRSNDIPSLAMTSVQIKHWGPASCFTKTIWADHSIVQQRPWRDSEGHCAHMLSSKGHE